mmetsp:Transcript_42690/g.68530  ORF Transcript_42690/g.68530 Transcript_42690/m.68530 type:complete len:171 (+) Transcript_42690:662-1174(+)
MFRLSRRFLFRELQIPNTGSVARDHLANERTFLAWARTALSLCGAGIALEALEFNTLSEYQHITPADQEDILELIPLFLNSRKKHIAALGCISLGGIFMSYALIRYIQVCRLLQSGQFRPNIYGILLTSASAAAIIGTCWIFISMESDSEALTAPIQTTATDDTQTGQKK